MTGISLMQQALGADWTRLPPALKAHYQFADNRDEGTLDIQYPGYLQPYLNLLRLLGALINRCGQGLPTQVEKRMAGGIQHWRRTIRFPDGREVQFRSHWVPAGGNALIEYVNPLLGLRMEVWLGEDRLQYRSRGYVLRLGPVQFPLPEWLGPGSVRIEEWALDEDRFAMDFRLHHPLLGEIYCYAGEFRAGTASQSVI